MKFERTVSAYVINSEGNVLMLKHKKTGAWAPLGGHLEEGELVHQAVIRECQEEAGIEIDFIYDYGKIPNKFEQIKSITIRAEMLPLPIMAEYDYFGDHYHEHFIYLVRAKNDEIMNNEDHEIGWFSFEDAKKLDSFDQVKLHLDYVREKLGK